MKFVLNNKTTPVVAAIIMSTFSSYSFGMDAPEVPDSTPNEHVYQNEVSDEVFFDLSDLEAFEFNPGDIGIEFPSIGGIIGGTFRAITPSFDYAETDSTLKVGAKYVTNNFLKKGTKEAIKTLPGGALMANAYGVYSKEAPIEKGEGTIARIAGDKVKEVVENYTGTIFTNAAENLKADRAKTFTESALLAMLPATNVKVEGETTAILGSIAQSLVISSVPFVGTEVVQAAGYLGKRYFGTETLTQGLLNSATAKATNTYSYLSSFLPDLTNDEDYYGSDYPDTNPEYQNS